MLRQSNLKGFEIPGVKDKLITTLFADDTTVYLSEFDRFSDLETILKKWCTASGARFNVDKTEAVPIGNAAYRNTVETTRCIHPSHVPLAGDIHIAKDGEAICTLGAWIGNNVDQAAIWSTILDKIRCSLEQWGKKSPHNFWKTAHNTNDSRGDVPISNKSTRDAKAN